MGRIYFVYFVYEPNTAQMNRALAYWKEIDRLKIKITVVFFLPNKKYSHVIEKFENVDFVYLWEKFYIDNKYFKYISYIYYQYVFLKSLQKGDKVYLYGVEDFAELLVKKKGIEVFYETTEHPLAVSIGSKLYRPSLKNFLSTCKKFTGIFVISSSLKKYFVSNGVESNKVHIINMTVDYKRFENVSKQKNVNRYIAYCGTVTNNKDGVDDLIKSFIIVAKRIKDVKLYIIGNIPSRTERLNNWALVKDNGLEDRVIFTGSIPYQDMPRMLRNASICALARPDSLQAQNGFPTKLGEYLLSANPVVVTNVGEIPLFLKHGVNAMLAEQRNPYDFAEKICWLLEHPEEAKIIGANGALVARKSFNSEIETEKLINIMLK